MFMLIALALAAIYAVLAIEVRLSPIYANNILTKIEDALEERAIRRACDIRNAE